MKNTITSIANTNVMTWKELVEATKPSVRRYLKQEALAIRDILRVDRPRFPIALDAPGFHFDGKDIVKRYLNIVYSVYLNKEVDIDKDTIYIDYYGYMTFELDGEYLMFSSDSSSRNGYADSDNLAVDNCIYWLYRELGITLPYMSLLNIYSSERDDSARKGSPNKFQVAIEEHCDLRGDEFYSTISRLLNGNMPTESKNTARVKDWMGTYTVIILSWLPILDNIIQTVGETKNIDDSCLTVAKMKMPDSLSAEEAGNKYEA